MKDTYNEDLKRSQEISIMTDQVVARGDYEMAYKLFMTDPLGVKDLSLDDFVRLSIDGMRRAFENWQSVQAHARSMQSA